jgi:hypothetical protein
MYNEKPIDAPIIETSCRGSVDLMDLDMAYKIIEWHTHPNGNGEFSRGDVDLMNKFIENYELSQVYYVLFQPQKNKSYWYQLKKTE